MYCLIILYVLYCLTARHIQSYRITICCIIPYYNVSRLSDLRHHSFQRVDIAPPVHEHLSVGTLCGLGEGLVYCLHYSIQLTFPCHCPCTLRSHLRCLTSRLSSKYSFEVILLWLYSYFPPNAIHQFATSAINSLTWPCTVHECRCATSTTTT